MAGREVAELGERRMENRMEEMMKSIETLAEQFSRFQSNSASSSLLQPILLAGRRQPQQQAGSLRRPRTEQGGEKYPEQPVLDQESEEDEEDEGPNLSFVGGS